MNRRTKLLKSRLAMRVTQTQCRLAQQGRKATMRITRALLATAFYVAALCAAAGHAFAQENWPQFRGAQSRGVSEDASLPTHWSASENVAWKTDLPGRGWSSPVVWGDRVFLTTVVNQGEGEAPESDPQMTQNRDPAGRPLNGLGGLDGRDVKIPEEADLQRSREILDELLRRAGERFRPNIERDYIDRLLKRF